jgi:hypothetical protein
MMDANYVIGSTFPTDPLKTSADKYPNLHSRITELQVHTLLDVKFNEHKIWTTAEIRSHLQDIAKTLSNESVTIYPNRLSDDGFFRHYTGNPTLPKDTP